MEISVQFKELNKTIDSSISENREHLDASFGETTTIHDGQNGATFIPSVSDEGIISWTNDRELDNPPPVNIKGRDGIDGHDGYTPIKGVDYFDGRDGKDGYTPIKGVDYFDGKDGKDGYTPIKGVDYYDGKDGQSGKDGYTPIKGVDYFDGKDGVSVTHSWNGTTLTIKSASGTSSADLKGDKGEKGEQGAQGVQGVKGDKGDKGDTGEKGSTGSPGKSCTHRWDGAYLYVTSASGTSYANLRGAQGIAGKDGADGYTPVKGTDYFTEADKAEMVADVIAALPVYDGSVTSV